MTEDALEFIAYAEQMTWFIRIWVGFLLLALAGSAYLIFGPKGEDE